MKTIKVVAAIIVKDNKIFATQRGYGKYKDWWEFPGGKIETGESPEEALRREIKEELDTEISVDKYLMTVEYTYPDFHLSMDCFICSILSGNLTLIEHEAARFLPVDNMWQVDWLPADVKIVETLERYHSGSGGSEAIAAVIWEKDDIRKILEDHNIESSTVNVDKVIDAFDVRHYEDKCVSYGWEVLENLVEELF